MYSTTPFEVSEAYRMALKDLGYDNVQIIFSDPENSPQLTDENGRPKAGTAFAGKDGARTIIINAEAEESQTKAGLIGTISEEGSHIVGKLEGRQIETGTDEKGLESTGRATNEYFKEKYKDDKTSIELASDGKDYSNVDFGENAGDAVSKISCEPRETGCVYDYAFGWYKANNALLDLINEKTATIEKNMKNIKNNGKKYENIIKSKGKIKALEAMELDDFNNLKDKWLGPFGKKMFAIYGASDEIRKQFLVPIAKTGEDDFYSKRPWNTQKIILDDYMPDETYRLFNDKASVSLVNNITNYWNKSLKNKNAHKIELKNRMREHKIVDFTFSNNEFTALGHTNLFTSTYGEMKKNKNGYDVNIVIFTC